ncbi:hypothetical protein NIES4072_17280 [Nostoc commune NIES-4072]|uniref:Uncharacterized protein n=1 Tax=Nostoc commune NIES-4072 TaxID=2005467 RepID=A0A2R5FR28_NOSCO|nr:hypothetical protein [Nostoc commune]BBD64610.1 hypothetical protein NIES4070_09530 [Nostoc commune HK-02]GBG18064.1 hypothetical protein NIES4072_17280 [Nostoc commune NIES-4072]
MSKVKHREPSDFTLKNDRSNHLKNAQSHLRSVAIIARNFNNHNDISKIADGDVGKLFNLTDDCSDTLKKYINIRKHMNKDQMVKRINSDLTKSPSYTTFDQERDWLKRFDNSCVVSCDVFIQNQVQINLRSLEDLYRNIITFRSEFGRTYARNNFDYQLIRERFQEYLNGVLQIASGTGLVCEDGQRYYDSNLNFQTRSIWLGSRMFLNGASNLLKIGGSQKSLIS